MRLIAGVVFAMLCAAGMPAFAAADNGPISDLRIEQGIAKSEFAWEAQAPVKISFTLGAKRDVSVLVARHLAGDVQWQSEYIAEPFPVREFKLGKLQPGRHEIVWDGLTADGKPVTETQVLSSGELKNLKERPAPDALTKEVPVDLFRITVAAGKETAWANFRRLAGPIDPNRSAGWFIGAVLDSRGNIVAAERPSWRGRRFSPAWRLEQTYPAMSHGHSSDPVECYDAAVDSKDNVYMIAANGIYKYSTDGSPAAWEDGADYLKFPYPISTKNLLGVRLDPNAKERKRYTFGPGGGGAGSKEYGPEDVKNPGFAFRWGPMAIDSKDFIYFAELDPQREIHVFEPSGKYVRSFPIPEGREVFAMRFGTDGTLWANCDAVVLGLDPQTGAVAKQITPGSRVLHVGPDGAIYVVRGSWLRRYTRDGESLPFTAKAGYVREDGKALNLHPRENNVPENAPGYASQIHGEVALRTGEFCLSIGSVGNPNERPGRILRFAADGTYLPELLSVSLAQHQPGNVFLDDEPARFDLLVNNLSDTEQELSAEWLLTGFDGRQTRGTAALRAAPLARQVLPLAVDASAMGHYTLRVEVTQAGLSHIPSGAIAELTTQLARIPSRKLDHRPDSAFAMCWGTNFHLMGLAGVKWERVGEMYWEKREPLEGIIMPDPPQAMQWPQSLQGYRDYALRSGILLPDVFSYGEPWLGGSFPSCRIYSYDRFFKFVIDAVDRHAGKNTIPYYQFWNEPNFFWHVPGPFSREHFALVAKHTWSIVKARDKDALAIPDGDAGGVGMMKELARFGANDYCDAAIIHYPGAQPLQFDKILAPDLPEGKVPMIRELVAVRDASFPGKPIWNTEEGWWQKNVSPQVGAQFVPRVYVPQLAIGVDRIWWFAQSSADDPAYLLDGDSTPWPSYVSYATMTRMLEGADCIGQAELGAGAFGYAFIRNDRAVLAAWSAQEPRSIALDAGAKQAVVTDLMGRETDVQAVVGNIPLRLTGSVQYVSLPLGAWAEGIAKAELKRRLDALDVKDIKQLGAEIEAAAKNASADPAAMTRLFHLVRAAKQAAFAGEKLAMRKAVSPKEARAAIEKKEGRDGYLRRARVALGWAEALQRDSVRQKKSAGSGLAASARAAAYAAKTIAADEQPALPGVVINAYLEPRSVREGADPAKPLDERFAFEIARKPGESFDLELTVWNYYRHPISGEVSPRPPDGWTATPGPAAYSVPPGEFQRFTFTVSIPADAKPGVYTVGGTTAWQNRAAEEIHTQRVKVGG